VTAIICANWDIISSSWNEKCYLATLGIKTHFFAIYRETNRATKQKYGSVFERYAPVMTRSSNKSRKNPEKPKDFQVKNSEMLDAFQL